MKIKISHTIICLLFAFQSIGQTVYQPNGNTRGVNRYLGSLIVDSGFVLPLGDTTIPVNYSASARKVGMIKYNLSTNYLGVFNGTYWVKINNGSGGSSSGITSLTGDVSASGQGAVAAVLAATGVTPGAYTNANITIDSKGRVTSAASGPGASGAQTVKLIDSVQQFFTLAKDTTVIVYCRDKNRTSGKAFVWMPSGTRFVDSAITYPAPGGGQWSMSYPGPKYYITWFGAVPNDSSLDATRYIQKAIDRAFADSVYVVGVPKGRFYIKGDIPPVVPGQSEDSFYRYNLPYQIQVPLETDFGSQKRLTIEGDFEGASSSPLSGLSPVNGFQSGCILESTIRPSAGRNAAVIGFRAYVGTFNVVSYSALKMENIIVLVNAGTRSSAQQVTMSAIDATYASQCDIDNVTVGTNIPYDLTVLPAANTSGIKMPHTLNFATSILGNVRSYAFYTGITLCEHTLGEYLTVIGCYYGVRAPNTGHRISINKLQVEGTHTSIFMNEQGESLYISSFGEEKGGQGWATWANTVETSTNPGIFGNHLFVSHYVNSGTTRMVVSGNPDFVHVNYNHYNDVLNGFSYEDKPDAYGSTVNHIDALFARNLNLVATTNQTLDILNLQTGQTGTILFHQNGAGTKTLTLPSSVTNFAGTSISVSTEAGYAISSVPNSITTIKYRFDGLALRFSTL